MGLSILAHFRAEEQIFQDILDHLATFQLEDGGWNCRYPRVKTSHSSIHTTLSVLEGLRELKKNFDEYSKQVDELIGPAHEFLMIHELFKSHTTKQVIHPIITDISFPPRWKYNILSALDYLRSINFQYDERMEDAIELVTKKSSRGYWKQGKQMAGSTFFNLNQPRKPSEWNTLRALRVIKKYH